MPSESETPMKVGRRVLRISNRGKIYFPESGITKGELVDYHARVAPYLLPHARDRFVSMERHPEGIAGAAFYQKQVPDHFPDWIRTEEVKKRDGTLRQLVIENAATLVYITDQGCITPHLWLSRTDRRDHPDRMIFDLDPPGDGVGSFADLRRTAADLRELLEELGLVPFLMTSGSRGLHIHVPLDRSADFDTVRAFAGDVVDLLVKRHPERLTRAQRKEARGEAIFLDVLRNAYAQTAVAPFAARAREGAPVATPLAWDELDRFDLGPRLFTIGNLFDRLDEVGDPWKGMGGRARSLRGPRARLDSLLENASGG